ncbi:MAG: adenylate/guanylate cyclase domain-containing protein, partial [Parafilimonas sp.]
AGHFEAAKKIIPDKDIFNVIEYIFKAGLEAKRAAAFEQAHNYFSSAIDLLHNDYWKQHYDFVLNLYYEATEGALLSGKTEEAEKLLAVSTKRAKTLKDSIKAHEIKLNHLSENHQFPETIAHLLQVLKEIGFPVKRNPGKLTILKEYAVVKWHLKNKKISDIPSLPLMNDEKALIFLRLTVNSLASIFGAAPDILPLVIFKQVQLSLKYGNSVYAPFAYCFYGFALCVFVGDLEKGYAFGKMSLQLTDQLHADVVKCKVMVSFYGFLSYWADSLRNSVLPLREAYEIGRKTGDYLYAAFALSFNTSIRLHSGDNLIELLDNMTEDCVTIKAMNQDLVYNISESQRQFVINFARDVKEPLVLNNEGFDEAAFLETLEKTNDEASKFDFYFYKMALACVFNEYDKAFENSEMADKYEEETTSRQITYPPFILFSAIAFIRQMKNINVSAAEKKKIYARIQIKIKLLKDISKHAPQNFENKYTLVMAFIAEYEGQTDNAATLFFKSITQSQKNNFIHEEALAREHFAYFYFETGKNEFGELMLKKAFECYQKWGAISKCKQLKNKFSAILGNTSVRDVDMNMSALQNIYDLNTIININHALSSENTSEGLLKKMLEIVMQNASITYGVIILKSQTEKFIPLATGSNEKIIILDKDAEENKKLFPASVVNYAARIKSVFVSDNFKEEKKFAFDTYNQLNHPVSVCAIPIINNDRVLGVLYLENNLAEGVFDSKRIEFFKTISSQLAISLDNSFLYAEMEQKIKQRTIELMSKNVELTNEKKKSDELLLNILPEETATELKNFGKTSARRYNSVTILFSDIKSFSAIAETLTPEDLVSELDFIFKKFDEISLKYHLEKIKTIGDAYMAVGGLPENNLATVKNVVQAAIEMLAFIKDLIEIRMQQGKQFFEIRLGIHTGPVIAGVVGNIKFQYDIWGDSVNLAARMEQNSEPGKLNISQATYNLIKDSFNCTYRGKITAKNMGDMDMYFVDGPNI